MITEVTRKAGAGSADNSGRGRFAFIGLGNIGFHLAASLARNGFALAVHDLDRRKAEPLLAAGAEWAESPEAAARMADSVFTCLPTPAAVAMVVEGRAGVLAGLRPGGTWVDMSTNNSTEVKRLALQAAKLGVHCLEAPVTGGIRMAEAGTISILIGGDKTVYNAHLPALQAIGGTILYVGPIGSASVIKVITNMLAYVHLVGIGEALALAKRADFDLGVVFAAIKASSGNSFMHESETPVILNGSYDIGFTLTLACKDMHLAQKLGRDLGVPLALADAATAQFERARENYGAEAGSPMVVRVLEDALGIELRAEGFSDCVR